MPDEIREGVRGLLSEQWEEKQKAQFLELLSTRGERSKEMAGFASVLRELAEPLEGLNRVEDAIDICGTGSDRSGTFNVSTTVMFVLAAAGIPVIKHGNRSISSRSGSADVLEASGARVDLSPTVAVKCFNELGVTFLFAPLYYKAFKVIAPVRRHLAERGVRTIFNLLGPLINPARPGFQLVGVYAPDLTEICAEVLQRTGGRSGMVAHGFTEQPEVGLDELSIGGPTRISYFQQGAAIQTTMIDARSFGIAHSPLQDLAGGTAADNARILRDILANRLRGGPQDLIAFNAAAGLMVAGKVRNFGEGILASREIIQSGLGTQKLEQFIEFTQSSRSL